METSKGQEMQVMVIEISAKQKICFCEQLHSNSPFFHTLKCVLTYCCRPAGKLLDLKLMEQDVVMVDPIRLNAVSC